MEDPLGKTAITLALLAGIAAMPDIGETGTFLFRMAFAAAIVLVILE